MQADRQNSLPLTLKSVKSAPYFWFGALALFIDGADIGRHGAFWVCLLVSVTLGIERTTCQAR